MAKEIKIGSLRDKRLCASYQCVAITLMDPNREGVVWMPELAPENIEWVRQHRAAHNDPQKLDSLNKQYIARLNAWADLNKERMEKLIKIVYECKPIAFVCFCPSSNPFCHTRLFREWLNGRIQASESIETSNSISSEQSDELDLFENKQFMGKEVPMNNYNKTHILSYKQFKKGDGTMSDFIKVEERDEPMLRGKFYPDTLIEIKTDKDTELSRIFQKDVLKRVIQMKGDNVLLVPKGEEATSLIAKFTAGVNNAKAKWAIYCPESNLQKVETVEFTNNILILEDEAVCEILQEVYGPLFPKEARNFKIVGCDGAIFASPRFWVSLTGAERDSYCFRACDSEGRGMIRGALRPLPSAYKGIDLIIPKSCIKMEGLKESGPTTLIIGIGNPADQAKQMLSPFAKYVVRDDMTLHVLKGTEIKTGSCTPETFIETRQKLHNEVTSLYKGVTYPLVFTITDPSAPERNVMIGGYTGTVALYREPYKFQIFKYESFNWRLGVCAISNPEKTSSDCDGDTVVTFTQKELLEVASENEVFGSEKIKDKRSFATFSEAYERTLRKDPVGLCCSLLLGVVQKVVQDSEKEGVPTNIPLKGNKHLRHLGNMNCLLQYAADGVKKANDSLVANILKQYYIVDKETGEKYPVTSIEGLAQAISFYFPRSGIFKRVDKKYEQGPVHPNWEYRDDRYEDRYYERADLLSDHVIGDERWDTVSVYLQNLKKQWASEVSIPQVHLDLFRKRWGFYASRLGRVNHAALSDEEKSRERRMAKNSFISALLKEMQLKDIKACIVKVAVPTKEFAPISAWHMFEWLQNLVEIQVPQESLMRRGSVPPLVRWTRFNWLPLMKRFNNKIPVDVSRIHLVALEAARTGVLVHTDLINSVWLDKEGAEALLSD